MFVMLVLALVVALALWLGRSGDEHRVFELITKEGVTGLQPQAGVRYKGVLVGRVVSIDLDPADPTHVRVRIAVNTQVPITRSTFGSLGYQGLTGLAFVQLDDTGASREPVPTSTDTVARIPMQGSLVSRLTDQGTRVLSQLELASTRINELLSPANQQVFMASVGQLGQAASDVSALTGQTRNTLQSLQSTSERVGSSADTVRQSAAEFQRMSRRWNEPGGTLDKITRGAEALAEAGQTLQMQLGPRVGRAADDAARAARQVGRTAESFKDNPQALLLGPGVQLPGPGEPGFVPPLGTSLQD